MVRAAVCNAACVELKMFRALEGPTPAGPAAITAAYLRHQEWLRIALSLSQADLEGYSSARLMTLANNHPFDDQTFIDSAVKTLMPIARKEHFDVNK